jgi:hypothetical protein
MTPFTPNTEGVFFDLPADVYHAAPGFSHSMSKNIEPPAKLLAYLKRPRKQTPAMLWGSILHHLVLTPAVKPFWVVAGDLRSKEWRGSEAHAILAANPETTRIDPETFNDLQAAAQSVLSHPDCQELLAAAHTEVSVFENAHRGALTVLCKARIDIVPADLQALGDIKTCQAADFESFQRAIDDHSYHSQAAWYLDIYNAAAKESRTKFKFIAIEREYPFLPCVWTLDARDIEEGRETNNMRLDTYAICSRHGEYPGYPSGEKIISRSNWARSRREREDRRTIEQAALQAERRAA